MGYGRSVAPKSTNTCTPNIAGVRVSGGTDACSAFAAEISKTKCEDRSRIAVCCACLSRPVTGPANKGKFTKEGVGV